MAEAEKQQKLVKLYTMIASGMAAMVAALFTSKLGVAGTLIGTALTAMTINLGSAVLSAQLAKKPPPRAPPCRSTCETVSLPRRFASPARRAQSQTRSRLRGLLTGRSAGTSALAPTVYTGRLKEPAFSPEAEHTTGWRPSGIGGHDISASVALLA